MTRLQRIKHAARTAAKRVGTAAHFAITGHWEGYEIDRYRNRPFRRLVSQDTDLDFGNREGLMSEARALCQTFGLPESILVKYANYCVGPCRAQWQTSDLRWNELAEANWFSASQVIDYSGTHDMRSMARIGLISQLRDSDSFFRKTTENGIPQLQAIEADRITNAKNSTTNIDTDEIIGGVFVNKKGVKVGYQLCDRNRHGIFVNPRRIPAHEMFQLFDPTRFDALRGVTAFKTALNHLRDIKETIKAWKTSVKAHSKVAFLIKNLLGGPHPSVDLFSEDTNAGEGAGTQKMEEIGDGIIQYMFRGDDVKTLESSFPPDQAMNLVLLLIRDIAVGMNLPFEFVWNMAGLGGPATRMMSTQAQRTFESAQVNLERRLINPTVAWVTSVSMFQLKRLPFNPEWYKFKIDRPPHTTIDIGRESTANLAEHQRGVLSGREIAEERGRDIYDVHTDLEREGLDLIDRAERMSGRSGKPFELCLSLLRNTTPNGNPATQQQQKNGGGERREMATETE